MLKLLTFFYKSLVKAAFKKKKQYKNVLVFKRCNLIFKMQFGKKKIKPIFDKPVTYFDRLSLQGFDSHSLHFAPEPPEARQHPQDRPAHQTN